MPCHLQQIVYFQEQICQLLSSSATDVNCKSFLFSATDLLIMYHHLNVFLVFGVTTLCQFSDKTLSYTGCPKKIMTKIECGGAKFYHERDLGRLDQA